MIAGRMPKRDPAVPQALIALAGAVGIEIMSHFERPWASITFSGSRHIVVMRFVGEEAVAAGDEFLTLLPTAEIAIAGQLLADASVRWTQLLTGPHTERITPQLICEVELLLLEDESRKDAA